MMTVLVVIGLAIAGGAVWWVRAAGRRKKELAEWAVSRRLAFNPAGTTGLDGRFPRFDCLVRGSGRHATNMAVGNWLERPFLAFDYHHDIPVEDDKGGTRTVRRSFSAVVMGSKTSLESLLLRPREGGDSDALDFGLDLVISKSKPFNQRFDARSDEPEWVLQNVLHPRGIEMLLAMPAFNIQLDSNYVIAYGTSLFSVEDFDSAAHILERILEELPAHIVRGVRAAG